MFFMWYYLLSAILLTLALSDDTLDLSEVTCESGQTYVKFIKKCGANFASEESFEVYSGSTLLYTSPTFANNEERTIEQCLTSSTNNQYTIKMKDSYGDSWSNGAYLAIFGKSGNAVFKSMLTHSVQEEHTISLYYGIEDSVQWKVKSGSITTGWAAYSFSDNDWTEVTLGSNSTTSVSGTQYFRKQFTGLASMAAYDVRLYYKAGVIAYINGNEVYRDNMVAGDVTSDAAAAGQHSTIAYRGFIRPGSEVGSAQSILAVELHFTSDQTQSYIDFNAYLAILAPSALDTTCFIYAEPVTLSASSTGGNPGNAFDFGRASSFEESSESLPVTLTFTFSNPRPYINSIRVWPYTYASDTPTSFTFQGSNDGNSWTNVVTVANAIYQDNTYYTFGGYFHSSLYSNYRASITTTSSSYMSIHEMQPLICSASVPTSITFTPNSFTYFIHYEQVTIKPDINEFTSCTAQNLPNGLSIDSTSCVISGYGTAAASGVTVTVSSVVLGNTYTGTFTISFTECAGTVINVLRTYKSGAQNESFDIKDATNQSVVMSVAYNSGQQNNQDWTTMACVTGTKYIVTTASSVNHWQSASHLYVRSVLSGNQMETILRVRYDTEVGFATYRTFNAAYTIKPHSNWYYRGDITSDWYTSTATEGWTQGNDGVAHNFTSQIQLYKNTFTVSDINDIAAVVLSIKYKYGIVVYLNGNEAFRNGVADATVSSSSYGSNIYSNVIYRQISLPLKTVQVGEVASVNYVQQGSNTIAIALVSTNSQQTEFNFDGAIRLMGDTTASRVFDYTVDYSSVSGSPTSIFNHYYGYAVYYTTCASNFLSIAFSNDRREWINALVMKLQGTQNNQFVRQFTLKARNTGDDWTTLSTVTDLSWSQTGQAQTIYFQNNIAFNEYRFENFTTGDTSSCNWRFNTLDLRSVMTTMTIPELSYGDSITVFKDIEMGEEYPNSEYYYGFTVSPPLPAGIRLDPNNGMISGTATAEFSQQISITAKRLTGGTSTATFTFSVAICTNGKSLITLVVRTDSHPSESSYKLYQGEGTSGTVVSSITGFQAATSLNYGDFCLNDGIYTVQLLDSYGDGWYNPAGYYLTVDVGAMIFEMGQLPPSTSSVSTMFSSYLPFQVEYSEWKISKEYAENWYDIDFSDSAWSSVKANAIGTNTDVTTYIRHDVNIPDVNKYTVLNVRVKYVGGVAAYFNGKLVARFNLGDDFDAQTESISVHDIDAFSKFHVIMNTVGGITGKNVMAFEIHRPSGESSAYSIIFDATGVFGVNECSIAVDTYSRIKGTTPTSGLLDNFLTLTPVTYGYQPNVQGTYLEWTVENLVGTKFNSFAMQTAYTRAGYGFSLYVRSDERDDYTSSLAVTGQSTQALSRNAWSVPLGIAGFTHLRFEVDVPASFTVTVSSYFVQYCKPSGSGVCPGIGVFPSVGEGEISPSACEVGYRGYAYRTCHNGVLGDIQTDKCSYKVPTNLQYDASVYNLILNTKIRIADPSYKNIIEIFYLADGAQIPAGLTLNTQTGEITGIPTQETNLNSFTIYGENPSGAAFVVIKISVQKGTCNAEGNFPTTKVGEVAVYDCASGGSYVGTQRRACNLGVANGEWGKATGYCMSVAMIVILVIVVIIVVVVVVFIFVRVNRKAKASGGIKGKSKNKSAGTNKKAMAKTTSKKSVKV